MAEFFEQDSPPRSLHSLEMCYVRFFNNTTRRIELRWVTYSGENTKYSDMMPGQYIDINTYKTHPFIAKDSDTKDMMHVGGNYFYYPRTSKEVLSERFPNVPVPEYHEVRVKVFITLPMYSLYYGCLLSLRNCLNCVQDVDKLELPKNLIEDVKKVIKQKNNRNSLIF